MPWTYVDAGLTLSQLLSIIWARKLMCMSIIAAVVAATVALLAFWPRSYEAVTSLMVNYEVNDPLNGKELPVGQVGSYIATQVELMQTPDVLLAVVDRLDLTSKSKYTSGYAPGRYSLREWTAAKLAKSLSIYQGQRGSQLIYIGATASSPAEAALLANTIADVYREQDFARTTGPPGQRAELYARQLQELKEKVDQAQKAVTTFHQRNGLVDEGNRANLDVVMLASLEDRLLQAQNSRRLAASRASGSAAVSDGVLASTEIQQLKSQLIAQESRLTQLKLNYTPRHPDIASQEAQVEETRRALASATQSYSANSRENLDAAERLEANLRGAVAEQRRRVLATSSLHDQAANLLLDLNSAQAVYKRALEDYDKLRFASAGHYRNVSVISRATPPVKASSPRVKMFLFLGGLAAMVLGLGIPLAIDLFNRRVRCRDDIERLHGVPVLIELGPMNLGSAR